MCLNDDQKNTRWEQIDSGSLFLLKKDAAEASELRIGYRRLRQVLEDIQPFLNTTECKCGDDGPCCKHEVEIALANFPKR